MRRHVLGVDLYLPWSHPLPDYTRGRSPYGKNLIALASALQGLGLPHEPPLQVVDIGANIGDSAAQIIAKTGAEVLCVEGDPYWVSFLRMNLGGERRAVIEEALLVPAEGPWKNTNAVRAHGTTRFSEGEGPGKVPLLTCRALHDRHPEFDRVRLIKSDTDGLDPVLVPAVAQVWIEQSPVLFFEYDPILAKEAGVEHPERLWERLDELGYRKLAVWENGGDPLGQLEISEAADAARSLEPRPAHLGYDFWDVAACRAEDKVGIDAVTSLVPDPFSVISRQRGR